MGQDFNDDRPYVLKLLTVVTESVLEPQLVRDIERLGARGYTITNARGKGIGDREAARAQPLDVAHELGLEHALGHYRQEFEHVRAVIIEILAHDSSTSGERVQKFGVTPVQRNADQHVERERDVQRRRE